MTHAFRPLTLIAMSALLGGLLASCGGGGGGGGSAPFNETFDLSGYATKGAMSNAVVKAFEIGPNGVVLNTPVKSTTTDSNGSGSYSLTGLSTRKRYIIEVSAGNTTTHMDEATGQSQSLPASDFVMKAVTPDLSDGSKNKATTHINPFTHQEVSAAEKDPGGLTTTNLNAAKVVVSSLYGFDPAQTPPDNKAQQVMLYAVSNLANDPTLRDSLGCIGKTGGAATTCVVKSLGDATRIDTAKLQFTNNAQTVVDVSGILKTSVDAAVSDLKTGKIPEAATYAMLTRAKLGCSGTGCNVAPPIDTNIASVKTVLNEIDTDLHTMFNSDGLTPSTKGAFNQQAYLFQQTAKNVSFETDLMIRNFSAMIYGAKKYQDIQNGVHGVIYDESSPTSELGKINYYFNVNPNSFAGYSCVAKQINGTTTATSSTNTKKIVCQSLYGVRRVVNVQTNTSTYTKWYHEFTLVPQDDAGYLSYTYTIQPFKKEYSCSGSPSPCTGSLVTALSSSQYTGTFQLRRNPDMSFAANINGDLPMGFVIDSNTWAPILDGTVTRYALSQLGISGRVNATDDLEQLTLGGGYAKYNNSTKLSELVLANGSTAELTQKTFNLNFSLTAYGASNQATMNANLTIDRPQTDASNTQTIPTHILLSGSAQNIPNNGTASTFISGSVEVDIVGQTTFNANLPETGSNKRTIQANSKLAFTAPNQPKLELVLGVSQAGDQLNTKNFTVSAQYNRYAGNVATPSRTVSFMVQPDAAHPTFRQINVSEATSNMSLVYKEYSPSITDLSIGGTNKGYLRDGVIYFNDGTFMTFQRF